MTSPTPSTQKADRYWQANLRLLAILLPLWFAASFGCGILLRSFLDRFTLPGSEFPLGFWFAQQGAILAFVGITFTYVFVMNRLDRAFGVDERDPDSDPAPANPED